MQQTFEGSPASGSVRRFRLPDVWEITRRFSGIAAIGVLGVAMLTLALRAEDATPSHQIAAAPPPPAAASPDVQSPAAAPTLATKAMTLASEPMVVFYLYTNESQRQMIMLAESIAGQEGAVEVTVPQQREFYALDVSTPGGEQAARDAIFEAMLLNDGNTRVLVHDLR